jgi:hypothetical protein
VFDGVRKGIVDVLLTGYAGLNLLVPEIMELIKLPLSIQNNGFALLNGKQNTTYNE